jgi:glycosyltransferase involved in cell wall biosynthesis
VLGAFGDRIRTFFQPNAGPSAARNRGVAEARGEWLTFQDADDLWVPDKLERQMESFRKNPSLDLCFGHLQNFWEPELRDIEERARDTWLAQPHPAHGPPLMLMRRELFERVGPFDTALRTGEDTDWHFRAREMGVVTECLPGVLLRRRRHGRNLTANWNASAEDMFTMLKRSIERRRAAPAAPPGSE